MRLTAVMTCSTCRRGSGLARKSGTIFLDCGLNTMDATTGDPVAIVGVLDCAAGQLLGFGFFDMLQGLKIADRLGLGWYDDVMGAMADSRYVNQLINGMCGFF